MWQAQQMGGEGLDSGEIAIVECVDGEVVSYGQQYTLFNVFEYVVPEERPTFDLRPLPSAGGPPNGGSSGSTVWFGLYPTNKAGREYLNDDEQTPLAEWVQVCEVGKIPFYIYEIQQAGGVVMHEGRPVADLTEQEH